MSECCPRTILQPQIGNNFVDSSAADCCDWVATAPWDCHNTGCRVDQMKVCFPNDKM